MRHLTRHFMLFCNICMLYCGAVSCSGPSQRQESGRVVVHPVAKEIYYAMHNDDYTVKVRVPGGEWQDLYEYKVKVDMDRPQEASMVYFDFEGTVEVMVRKNNGMAESCDIRPHSAGIHGRLDGNVLYFTLDRPMDLSVEFDGDRLRNLHVFTNAPETDVPSPGDEGVMYFATGQHEPEDGSKEFVILSDTYVYLAPGAVLKGTIVCDSVRNVRIGGRGMLLTPQRGIQASFSENIEVDDIVVINPRHYTLMGGQSKGIIVRNLRSFSYQGWSDGIDIMSCSDVLVDGVFMRNSDDCIAIYGPRWEYRGDVRNITVQNSVLWADIAHPFNMGTHGYTEDGIGNTISDVVFRNIDILQHDEDDPPYRGCMAISCGDLNLIRDILFEDVRVEDVQEGKLFHVEVMFNEKYNTAPGRGIRNVTFRNVSCDDIPGLSPSSVKGYDSGYYVDSVFFENVRIGGRRMKSLEGVETNGFIRNIIIR